MHKRRKIIVGVDPGLYKGIAVLDLSGNLLYLNTIRDASLSDVVELLSSIGEVVAVSTDVSPAPDFVRLLAAKMNAVLIQPRHSLSKEEKAEIARALPGKREAHEVDAYAAVVKAFRRFQNRFRSLDKLNLPEEVIEELKKGVIEGKAVDQILRKAEEDVPQGVQGEERREVVSRKIKASLEREEEKTIAQLKKVLSYQEQRIRKLEEELRYWKRKAKHLENVLRFLHVQGRRKRPRKP